MNTTTENPPSLLGTIGLLRLLLGLFTLAIAPLALFAANEPVGWYVVPVYLGPVFAILLFWGLLLDLIMTKVFMAEKSPEVVARYRSVLHFDLALLAILLLAWLPFFYGLVI